MITSLWIDLATVTPNPGLATLAGSFHHIWRSEMMAYIFLGIIVALALYWLFAHENPAKEE